MSNYRNRPKGKYIKKSEYRTLLNWTQKWTHNLEDYLYEIVFLERLMDNYFGKLLLSESIEDLRSIQITIINADTKCKGILEKLHIYSTLILGFIAKSNNDYAPIFRADHKQFEDEILSFINTVDEIRRVASVLIRSAVEDEKHKYAWKYN